MFSITVLPLVPNPFTKTKKNTWIHHRREMLIISASSVQTWQIVPITVHYKHQHFLWHPLWILPSKSKLWVQIERDVTNILLPGFPWLRKKKNPKLIIVNQSEWFPIMWSLIHGQSWWSPEVCLQTCFLKLSLCRRLQLQQTPQGIFWKA